MVNVKDGFNSNLWMMRDLVGTIESKDIILGAFIVLVKPSKGMRRTVTVYRLKIDGLREACLGCRSGPPRLL